MLAADTFQSLFTHRLRWKLFLNQVVEIGLLSQLVVVITGGFTGAVFSAQTYFQFHKIGMGSEVEEHGGRTDDPACIGIFGDENQRVVREDGALQPEFVVHLMMGIVGAVDREKDLADLADIFFAGFSDPNHDSPVRLVRNGAFAR